MRIPLARRLLAPALVCLGALAACHDSITAPVPARPLDRPPAPNLVELVCRANVAARTVSCGSAASPAGASADLIAGGQGVYVQLTSSNITVANVPDPLVRDTFAFDVTLQNLIPQALGTSDGTTPDPGGVRTFLSSGPTATSGSGAVVVANPDGLGTFTGINQPYFQYAGPLATDAVTPARRWKVAYDSSVGTFSFNVYVSAAVQYPDGWVDVDYGTLTPQMAPGATGQPAATVRDPRGVVMGEPVTYQASAAGFAISGNDVTAGSCGSGPVVITGTAGTRPARRGVAVRVAAPAFSAFSPDPYAAAGSAFPRTASLSASFAYCTVVAGPSTFAVHGMQGSPALLGGSYTGAGTSTATYQHTGSFFPGEQVEVTLTSALAAQPRVTRFRAATGAASGTFLGQAYATGFEPFSVAAGDVNGDGRVDLVTADYFVQGVSVLLRNATNTAFDTRLVYPTGSRPVFVVIADLNGDGRQDLAVANSESNTVSVLLRDAANTGFDRVDYATGAAPLSVAVGDVNGDGKPDLAVANSGDGTVSVLLRNAANIGFDARVNYAVGTIPASVAVGDVNGDGRMDLAVANSGASTVSVLLRLAGNSGFAAKVDYATGTTPVAVAIGDLNGDGRMDLAVANQDGMSASVMLRNAANNGFGRSDLDLGQRPEAVALGDANGDGRTDLALVGNGVVLLLRNAANTGYDARAEYPAQRAPHSVVFADANGDGRTDLAVANLASNSVSVLLRNTTNDGYDGSLAHGGDGRPVVGDINGDGRLDVVVASQGKVSVLLRNAANTGFDAPLNYPTANYVRPGLAVGDVNGDGRLDVVVANYLANTVSVLLRNSANTGFDPPVDYATAVGPNSVTLGDLNGDGRLDVVVANFSPGDPTNGPVSVLLRNASNTGFEAHVDYAAGNSPYSVAIGDLNADGRMDLVVADANGGMLSVLLAKASGTGFEDHVEYSASNVLAVAIGDVNGDGRMDVVAAGADHELAVLLQVSNGFLGRPIWIGTVLDTWFVDLGDMNGDGRLDVMVGAVSGGVTVLLRNAANTGFDRADYDSPGEGMVLADVNGDGRLDIVSSTSVLLNKP